MRDPEHSILPQASHWRIIDFHWQSRPDEQSRTLDITFWREGVSRRLRFTRPHSLKVEDGILHRSGLAILDIRGRGWEDKVEVINFECHSGLPEFIARDVFDLDDPANEMRRLEAD